MRKYWLQVRSNMAKAKSSTVALIIMFIISALLLNIGLLITLNYGAFFTDLKKELHSSDAYFMMADSFYTKEVEAYFAENEHILKTQTEKMILTSGKIESQGTKRDFSVMFQNMDLSREITKWKFVGPHLEAKDMSVYVPDVLKAVSGYQLDDELVLLYRDVETGEEKELSLTVKGYTEDIFFSSTDTGPLSFFVSESTYQKIEELFPTSQSRGRLVFTNFDEIKNTAKAESELREILNLNTASLMTMGDESTLFMMIDIELIEMARCVMVTMVSSMMVVFALIIVAVCLLVVRFRIVNSIEDDMLKIGSLKSIGYTSRQIIGSILLQFCVVTGVGGIIGIALSFAALPAVSLVFEQQSGLKWEQGFDLGISSMTAFILLSIMILVALLAARKVIKLSPINALRGDDSSKKSKKIRLPLEKSKGSISFALALKHIFQNLKQTIMISIIIAAVTFIGSFGVIMLYNTSVDTTAFASVPGMEICNAIAVLNTSAEQDDTISQIENMENVRKTQYLDELKVRVEGIEVSSYIMADYEKKETKLVYEGRYPSEDNEIAVAGVLAERLEKKIGDTILVSHGSEENVFRITGLTNGAQMGGMNVSLRTQDYQRLWPEFTPQLLNIYLEKGTDAAAFVEHLENTFSKEILLSAIDFDKGLEEGMASYQNIVAIMGVVMFVITILVVALVIYFVIGASIIQRKRELGILKAIGHTTFQLMNQITAGFSIPIILGGVAGSLLGAFYTNTLLSFGMKGMGIMKVNFIVEPLWVMVFCAITIVFSYVLSLLVTWRIRKISAYALVTE